MGKQIHFTNEALLKQFGSTFQLVNYAISMAREMIYSGKIPPSSKKHSQNIARYVLDFMIEEKRLPESVFGQNAKEIEMEIKTRVEQMILSR